MRLLLFSLEADAGKIHGLRLPWLEGLTPFLLSHPGVSDLTACDKF
jgi:hypothetical protein